jgi:hypothetical protein
LASTGISRNGAAQRLGVEPDTLGEWLSRGKALPDVEPWGSFAQDYLQAERGLEEAATSAVALRVQAVLERQRMHLEWAEKRGPEPERPAKPARGASEEEHDDYAEAREEWEAAHRRWDTPPPEPSLADFEWVMRVMTSRYPRDHGIHPHRLPEPFPDGSAWLERHQLTQEQLTEMFRKPPEPVQEALVAAADEVYALLCASGWSPEGRQPDGMVSVPSDGDGRGEDRSEGETGPRE